MKSNLNWNRRDWLMILIIAVVCVLAWFPVLFFKDRSFGVELDFIRQFYPARYFAVDSVSKGIFPLWNPYVFCGYPFFASYQTALLYPFNTLMIWLYAISGSTFSIKAQCGFVVFHFFLAGVFMYVLAREFNLNRYACAISAFTFMFCGYMTAHAGHLNQHSAAAWIPFVFLLFYRAAKRKSVTYALLSGVALGIALLAGHFQPIFYLCFMLLIYAFYLGIASLRKGERTTYAFFGLLALLIMIAAAVLLTSAQLLPTYEMIGISSRHNLPFEIASTYSLPRKQIITLLFPHFYGSSPENYTGGWAPAMWELYGYSGVLALILGVVAFLRREKEAVGYFWIMLVLSVLLALGPGGYVFTLLFKAGLLFDRFRDPARILVLFGFCSAVLAGFGADHVIENFMPRSAKGETGSLKSTVLSATAFILIVVVVVSGALIARGAKHAKNTEKAIRGMLLPCFIAVVFSGLILIFTRVPQRGWLMGAGLLILVLFDLAVHNTTWPVVRINPHDLYADREASEYLARKKGVFRVETDAHTMYEALDNGPIYRLDKTTGDDSLVLLRFHQYREMLVPSVSPGVQPGLFYEGSIRSPLLDLMNAAYLVSREKIPDVLAKNKFALEKSIGGVQVYRNHDVLPRAFIACGEFVSDGNESLKKVSKSNRQTLESHAFLELEGDNYRDGDIIRSVSGTVKLTRKEPGRLVIDIQPESRGVLVLAEAWYPGWEAFVDGAKAKIYKADYLFMGVILDRKARRVEFVFRPRTLRTGIYVSCTAVALLFAYFAMYFAFRNKSECWACQVSVSKQHLNQVEGD